MEASGSMVDTPKNKNIATHRINKVSLTIMYPLHVNKSSIITDYM